MTSNRREIIRLRSASLLDPFTCLWQTAGYDNRKKIRRGARTHSSALIRSAKSNGDGHSATNTFTSHDEVIASNETAPGYRTWLN
jgi:hypothetical protein